jgi:drug/metabolite transporter (DMT)-like permease
VVLPAGAPGQAPWRLNFVLLAVIWGSSFLCIKVLGEDWAAVTSRWAGSRSARSSCSGCSRPAHRAAARTRGLGHLAVVGFLMNALPFTLFAYGETKVSSILAGLWNATTPLMVLVVVLTVMREERPDRRALLGLAGGFAGVALLLGPWKSLGGDELLGHLACLGAAACYGMGVPYTRRYLSARPESGPSLAAAQLACGTAMLLVVAPLAGAPTTALAADAVVSLLVLGVWAAAWPTC